MKRRKWDPQEKAIIVLEGLKGKQVAEICNEYQIGQAQYYQWREQFLKNASKAFEDKKKNRRELSLTKENDELKKMVGELTVELKKTEELLG